ncbi:MAG: hypothetical protein M3Z24_07385, partial [Chloroflexota bacterium]|nr:hypothetical protein [Chloroflexota bacterium]
MALFRVNRDEAEFVRTLAKQLTELVLIVETGEGDAVFPARYRDIVRSYHGRHIDLGPLLSETLRFQLSIRNGSILLF